MTAKIRGSDVYVVSDIERILVALAGASGRYGGEYSAGYQDALRDLASAVGASIAMPCERIHEVIEYRHERTIERYAQPAERQFKIVGQREEPAAMARQAPADMTGDDVSITVFNPKHGELRARAGGWVWVGNDGQTAFWAASDWQQISETEANLWGELLPDKWIMLARHAYAESKRRQFGQSVRVLGPERRLLR